MAPVSSVAPPDGVLHALGGASDQIDEIDELRTSVTIGRTHPTDCGMRQVFAKLDNILRVALTFGESVTEDVPPGHHRLRVHNTLFWKTIDFTIEPGEHLEFLVINTARWWTFGMAAVLGSAPLFLTVRKTSVL